MQECIAYYDILHIMLIGMYGVLRYFKIHRSFKNSFTYRARSSLAPKRLAKSAVGLKMSGNFLRRTLFTR
jgi:hypothetical protein